MLWFFRRYQRIFLSFFAGIIVISFSFVGTSGVMRQTEVTTDRLYNRAVDGSKVYEKEIRNMRLFLENEATDGVFYEDKSLANYCNDGVFTQDILNAGIAKALFQTYKEQLNEDFADRLAMQRDCRLYRHPTYHQGYSTAIAVWQQFSPQLLQLYAHFQAVGDNGVSDDLFDAIHALYLQQKQFPPHLLRSFLVYNQQQDQQMPPDPYLARTDLSIFHAKSSSAWFGRPIVDLAAQYLHNSACIAKQHGHRVTLEEARRDLLDNIRTHIQQERGAQGVDPQEIKTIFFKQAQKLGMGELELTQVWQKVLLHRRLWAEVSHCIVLDNTMYTDFSDYTAKTKEIELVELMKPLRHGGLRTAVRWASYMQGVKKTDVFSMTTGEYKSLDEVMQDAPELVQKTYKVKLVQATKRELTHDIGLKELRRFQVTKENWAMLCQQFPHVLKAKDNEDLRCYQLDNINRAKLKEIDAYSAQQILLQDPLRIEQVLDRKEADTKELQVSCATGAPVLPGVTNIEGLLASLREGNRKEGYNACYTEDQENYYRLIAVEEEGPWHVLEYAEAEKGGMLQALVQRTWEQQEKTASLEDALTLDKELIYKAFKLPLKEGEPWVFAPFVLAQHNAYVNGEDIFAESNAHPLQQQWKMTKRTVNVHQTHIDAPFTKEVFDQGTGYVSNLDINSLTFYKILSSSVDEGVTNHLVSNSRNLLQREIQERYAKVLLEQFVAKEAIVCDVNKQTP